MADPADVLVYNSQYSTETVIKKPADCIYCLNKLKLTRRFAICFRLNFYITRLIGING